MILKVNAKINLGLYITGKRPDGYHTLQTIFYPVGLKSGTPESPWPFGDLLEITPLPAGADSHRFTFTGLTIDCPMEKNLVVKAVRLYDDEYFHATGRRMPRFDVRLEKHIPFGAGLGGGSADASFTLMLLNELCGFPLTMEQLAAMAARLGADCPFFLLNRPCVAEGIGEVLTPIDLDLSGMWLVIVKPEVSVSTAEAFRGIKPEMPAAGVAEVAALPIDQWQERLENRFEPHIFAAHPELPRLKRQLQQQGAVYTAMSGSGSSIFGIFDSADKAADAYRQAARLTDTFSALTSL